MMSSCKPAKNILYFCARFVTRKNLFTFKNWKREICATVQWGFIRGLINTGRPGNAYMRTGLPLVQIMTYHWFNTKRLPEPRATFRPQGPYSIETRKEIERFSFKEIHLKISFAKWRPFSLTFKFLSISVTCSISCAQRRQPPRVIVMVSTAMHIRMPQFICKALQTWFHWGGVSVTEHSHHTVMREYWHYILNSMYGDVVLFSRLRSDLKKVLLSVSCFVLYCIA